MNNVIDFFIKVIEDAGKGIKGYIKAQFILMLITFIILSIGLTAIDVSWPILIALGIAVLDILPVVGSGIIMVPWSIVCFIVGKTDLGIKLAILYVSLAIIRQIIEPKIVGDQIGIRPLYTFFATIIGSLILGPVGVIIGPVIVVVVSSIFRTNNKLNKN